VSRILDFMDYASYLASPRWCEIRKEALARAGGRCQVCGNRMSLEVHHNSYENLGEEEPEDLCVLCDECHELFSERLAAPAVRNSVVSPERTMV